MCFCSLYSHFPQYFRSPNVNKSIIHGKDAFAKCNFLIMTLVTKTEIYIETYNALNLLGFLGKTIAVVNYDNFFLNS